MAAKQTPRRETGGAGRCGGERQRQRQRTARCRQEPALRVPAPAPPDWLPSASRTRIGLLHPALRQRAVMAIKLVTEVMDWAPPLTHREHKVLMILAENARLPSRETWDSVESPRILRRARLTRAQMYAVIAALVDEGMPG